MHLNGPSFLSRRANPLGGGLGFDNGARRTMVEEARRACILAAPKGGEQPLVRSI